MLFFLRFVNYFLYSILIVHVTAGLNTKIDDIKSSTSKHRDDEDKMKEQALNLLQTADAPTEINANIFDENNANTSDASKNNKDNTSDIFSENEENTSDVSNERRMNLDVSNENEGNGSDVPNETRMNSDVSNENKEDTSDFSNENNKNTSDIPNENNSDVSNRNNDNTSVKTLHLSENDCHYERGTFDLSQDTSWRFTDHCVNGYLSSLQNIEGYQYNEEEVTKFKIWPQGTIPYFIDSLSFDIALREKIRHYLDVTSSLTGLRFQELPRAPAEDETRYVFFVNRRAWMQCKDYTHTDFTNTGIQRVIVGYDCLDNGREIAKIVMALLSIPLQHNSPDRDENVEYNEEAVLPDKKRFYEKVNDEDWLFKDITYDFSSVTHFPFYKNSVNGQAVLKPLKDVGDRNVGELKGFSYSDLHKIRFMYNSIKTKSDEKIKYSNCKKLYNKPDSVEPENLAMPQNDRDPKNRDSIENNKNVANILVYGNENPPARPMGKQGFVKLSKQSNRIVKQKQRHVKALAMAKTEDPIKWDDVHSDDK